jgi:hypothetical protein
VRYETKEEELYELESVKVKLGEVELKVDQKDQELALQREMLARTNHQLEATRDDFVVQRLTGVASTGRPQYSKTCALFRTQHKHQPSAHTSPNPHTSFNSH